MKTKRILLISGLLLSLIIILSLFVLAQTAEEPSATPAEEPSTTPTSSIKDKSNELLSQQISLPPGIEPTFRVIFGLKAEQTIDVQTITILACIWTTFFLILQSILLMVPFFGEGWKSWVGGAIITTLISLTGTLNSLVEIFLGFGNFFQGLSTWRIFKLGATIIILIILLLGARSITKIFKEKYEVEKAKTQGFKLGLMQAKEEAREEAEDEMSGGLGI